MAIPYTDFKTQIKPYVRSKWQQRWDQCIYNRLHCIQPNLGNWKFCRRADHREESVLSRIRIGHTYFTHNHLLKREDQPECIPCQCPLSVRHILVECVDFAPIRSQYFEAESLKELFENYDADVILSFLKEIGLFSMNHDF